MFTHRYIVLHVLLVRARLRDQALMWHVLFLFIFRIFYREPQPSMKRNAYVRTCATRERDITRRRWTPPIPLSRATRSIGSRADFRPAGFATYDQSYEAHFEERERKKKKREREGKKMQTRCTWTEEETGRDARMTSPRFVVHDRERKRGKRKTRYPPGRP